MPGGTPERLERSVVTGRLAVASGLSRQPRLLFATCEKGGGFCRSRLVQSRGLGQFWGIVPGCGWRGTHVGGRMAEWQNGLAAAQGPASLPLTPGHLSATLAEYLAECPPGLTHPHRPKDSWAMALPHPGRLLSSVCAQGQLSGRQQGVLPRHPPITGAPESVRVALPRRSLRRAGGRRQPWPRAASPSSAWPHTALFIPGRARAVRPGEYLP
jgi:hypothetical protein